jgi:diaminohydroxyphosphoribosylaminopyrimidine deaminase/5-amino-6-(5-phosphoribosylamino)uracil reductase
VAEFTPQEEEWMQRALALAKRGFTPPNPMVGCLIVKGGKVIGEGYHPYAGQPHAEVFALREAGNAANGATAYITLEPCSHWGRTPPCAEALIAAGIRRVVIATLDNNPKVSGKGVAQLQEAGIESAVGLLETEARQLNEAFFYFHTHIRPFTTLKTAMTLDGKIATANGDSHWITSPPAREYVHLLRAQSGAVLTGIGTVLKDDPQLNARLPNLPRQPLRIIVDSHLRTPPDSALLRDPLPGVLIATTLIASHDSEKSLLREGVEILRLPATETGRVDLKALWKLLAERNCISVLVEGGGELNSALLDANLVQKALFFVAPKILGGITSPTPIEGKGRARMADAIPLFEMSVRSYPPDMLIEGYLHSTKTG